MRKPILMALCVGLLTLTQSNCNVFEFMDGPSEDNDEQLISYCRACFDDDDFECAIDCYQDLSEDKEDIKHSERAFATLHREGASLENFFLAFASGSGAKGFTKLANTFIQGAGETKRRALYGAFVQAQYIKNNQLRGLVRFIAATSVAAEIFAEQAGQDSKFDTEDMAANPTDCKNTASDAAGCLGAATGASCELPSGGTLSEGTTPNFKADATNLSGTFPTMGMLDGAIEQMVQAVDEAGIGGKFDKLNTFSDLLNALPDPSTAALARCYRRLLLDQGVGSE